MPSTTYPKRRSSQSRKTQSANRVTAVLSNNSWLCRFFIGIPLTILFCISFIDTGYLFNGMVSGKWAGFEIGLLVVSFCSTFTILARRLPGQSFRSIDIIFVALVAYIATRTDSLHTEASYPTYLYLAGIACLWFLIKNTNTAHVIPPTIHFYLLAAIAQSSLGLMQIYGLYGSKHSLFALTGTFHNPGPYAGYLASAMPVALGVLLTKREKNGKRATDLPNTGRAQNSTDHYPFLFIRRLFSQLNLRAPGIIGQASIILLLLVLPATRSRAAWLAALGGSLFTCWPMLRRVPHFLWNRKLHRFRHYFTPTALWGVIITVFLSFSVGLYHLKKESANGRLLMWQVSWQLVKEDPFLGHGWNSFGAKYMDAQAQWFANGKGIDAQKLVAGEPEAPFNEPIRLLVELGLVGFLMIAAFFTLLIAALLRMQKRTTIDGYLRGIGGGIVTIFVFSLFSYPMDVAPIMAQLLVLTAVLGNATSKLPSMLQTEPPHCVKNKIITWFQTHSRWLATVLCIGFVIVVLTLIPTRIRHYQGLSQWAEANQLYQLGAYEAAARQYATANEQLGDDGLFLQMYAKCMQMQGFNEEALALLETALQNHNGTIVQLTMGDCHAALGDYAKAIVAYQAAWDMIPSRLYPGYKLALLYQQIGETALARATAQKVLDMPIKVQSTAVTEIREQMAVISEQ